MTQESFDKSMMQRALQLAANGMGYTSPNPMVGAVITDRYNKIIGEGWHRRYGGPHAEVNAVASVADKSLLHEATIYVTLEPCSHYGKTPPCAKLLVESGFHRVVVGAPDPNPLVSGRGIRMIREAGIEVTENVLVEECIAINRRFMTAHTLHRPWIQLKWAQSADGFIGRITPDGTKEPIKLSSAVTKALMHRERSLADAIMVGTGTIIADNPSLSLRHYPGRSPRPVIFASERIPQSSLVLKSDPIILDRDIDLKQNMEKLFSEYGITSLMVEGGSALLNSFISAELYDEIRVEVAPVICNSGIPAPAVPAGIPLASTHTYGSNRIDCYHSHQYLIW